MKQSKAQFILDYYITVKGIVNLDNVTDYLNSAGVTYCVEAWPKDYARIYVRKDAKRMLEVIAETFDEEALSESRDNSEGLPVEGNGQRKLAM